MIRLRSIILGLALSSCQQQEPNYCANAPNHNCMDQDGGVGSDAGGCTNDQQCSGVTAVCNLGSSTCVQCTTSESAACVATTPVCGADDMCHACVKHDDCASMACLPDGSCGTDSNVAYVDPGGTDNAMCTKALPCTKVAKALATSRPYVKFHGTTDEGVAIGTGRDVTLLADSGAVLTRSSGTAILTVTDDGTKVRIFDLAIQNAPNNASGFGIVIPTASGAPTLTIARATIANNPGGGISASGGTLTVTQSTISGNSGGGVSVSNAQFSLVNNFIVENGGPTSTSGGVDLQTVGTTGMHQVDFNTITANAGASTVNSGINCGTVTTPLTLDSNIIYGNSVSGGGHQIGGSANCSTTYSDIGPDTTVGTGNINADPLYANAVGHNYHLTTGSSCKDTADPSATLDVDVDGDHRPQGARRDIGADEFK